ncbi:MAG: peptidoglycan-binding protein, partial [bacterium]
GSNTVTKLIQSNTDATVTSTIGTVGADSITNIPYGTSLATFKAGITPATGATWNVYDANGTDIATVLTSSSLLKVVAEDGNTTKTYTLTINSPSTDATVTSTIGTVGADSITNIPYGTSLATFKAGITPATGATWNVYDANGTDIATVLTSSSLLKVVAEDGNTTKTYTLTINSPSTDATVTAVGDYVVGTSGGANRTITNVPFGTSLATFKAGLAKGEPNQSWDETHLSNPIITNDYLVVTAQDGTTIITYTVTTNSEPVTPPNPVRVGGGRPVGGGGGGSSSNNSSTQNTFVEVKAEGCGINNSFSPINGLRCPENSAVVNQTSNTILPISEIKKEIRDLKIGIIGSDVRNLQRFLIKQNKGPQAQALASHGLTNNFQTLTEAALIEWQKENGLTADGVFGPSTKEKMFTIVSTQSVSSPPSEIQNIIKDLQLGDTGSDVRTLQKFLIKQNKGPEARALAMHGLTNNFQTLTKAALIEWQKANGLKVHGVFGLKTKTIIKLLNV